MYANISSSYGSDILVEGQKPYLKRAPKYTKRQPWIRHGVHEISQPPQNCGLVTKSSAVDLTGKSRWEEKVMGS